MKFVVLILLFVFLFGASAQKDNTAKGDVVKAKGCGHCQNLLNSCGIPGTPGSNGMLGMPGVPGLHGKDGSKGEKGDYGPQGSQGVAGASGKLGPRGFKGSKGEAGEEGKIGANGTKGEKGDAAKTDPTQRLNWKQCVWKVYSGADSGKIIECSFNKLHNNSALRVSYQGNLIVIGSSHCNRWFFKFNGSECSGPMTIEAVVLNFWSSGNPNLYHHRSFEGYCENLGRGTVSVELWVGKCSSGHTLGDAQTGSISVSRIMIEEVPPSQ